MQPFSKFDILQDRKLLCVTGKGGSGKTLVSACLARKLQENKRKALIVEWSQVSQVAPLFDPSISVGHHQKIKLTDSIELINVDPHLCLVDYFSSKIGREKIFRRIIENDLIKTFLFSIPGFKEVMVLGRLVHYAMSSDAVVIFDAPATGHFVELFKTPQAIIEMKLGGAISDEIREIEKFLNNDQLHRLIVCSLSESLVVSETIDLYNTLRAKLGYKVDAVVLTRYLMAKLAIDAKSVHTAAHNSAADHHMIPIIERWLRGCQDIEKILAESMGAQSVYWLNELGFIQEPLNSTTYLELTAGE